MDGQARNQDAAGNTTSIGGKTFAYNDANRMSAVKQGDAVVESYGYNHRGERVLRAPASGDAQVTVYDEAGQWVGNYSATAQAQQQAIWLDNYPVALIQTPASGVPELAYIQPDHLGTPRVVIDPVRDVAIWEWSNKSEVFGDQAPANDPDGDGVVFDLALRFPGQQATDASGLFYNYQREYDPAVGRYSQSDPISLDGGISTFAYVTGRPTSLSDTFGLQSSITRAIPIPPPGFSDGNADSQNWNPDMPNYGGSSGGSSLYPHADYSPIGIFTSSAMLLSGLINQPLLQFSKKKSDRGGKPDGCPSNTRGIDEVKGKYGLSSDDVHKIKKSVGAGPPDWTGIDSDGNIWTHGEGGMAEDHGRYDEHLPSGRGRGR